MTPPDPLSGRGDPLLHHAVRGGASSPVAGTQVSETVPPNPLVAGNTVWSHMWHMSSRTGMATLRTAIHLLLTYFLTRRIGNHEKTARFTTIMCKISSSVQYVTRMSTFKLFCFCFASLCGRTLVDDDYLVSFQHLDGAERSGCHVDCCVPATPSLDNEKTACRTRCREAILLMTGT